METVGTIIGIGAGAFAILAGLFGAWRWLTGKSSQQGGAQSPSPTVSSREGPAVAGTTPTVADRSGVAFGPGQLAPTIIAQAGANVNVYQGDFQASQDPEASDAYTEGVRLQKEEKHLEAIKAFERAFAAACDQRNRAVLHLRIGISFLRLSRLTEAEAHFCQASDALQSDNSA